MPLRRRVETLPDGTRRIRYVRVVRPSTPTSTNTTISLDPAAVRTAPAPPPPEKPEKKRDSRTLAAEKALVAMATTFKSSVARNIKSYEDAIKSNNDALARERRNAARISEEGMRKKLATLLDLGWEARVEGNYVTMSKTGDFCDKLARPLVVFRGTLSFLVGDRGQHGGPFLQCNPVDPATNKIISSRSVPHHWYVSSNGVCMGNFRDRFIRACSALDIPLAAALVYQVVTTAPAPEAGPYHHHSEFASIVRCDGDLCNNYYVSLSLARCPNCGSTKRTGIYEPRLTCTTETDRPAPPPPTPAPTPISTTPTGTLAELWERLRPNFRTGLVDFMIVHITDAGHPCMGCGQNSPGDFQLTRDGRIACRSCPVFTCEYRSCRQMFSWGSSARPNRVYVGINQLRNHLFGTSYVCPTCIRRELQAPRRTCVHCGTRLTDLNVTRYNSQGVYCNEACVREWAANNAMRSVNRFTVPDLNLPQYAAYETTLVTTPPSISSTDEDSDED